MEACVDVLEEVQIVSVKILDDCENYVLALKQVHCVNPAR